MSQMHDRPRRRPKSRRKKKKSNLLIILAACGGGLFLLCCGGSFLLLPAVQQAREAARQSVCQNNLRQISLALHSYHDMYQCFPPAYVADAKGKPMHSWRVLILPFLEASPPVIAYRFDEPWNGPNNRRLADQMPAVFRCPSSPYGSPMTHYVAVSGPNAAFNGRNCIKTSDITDGASNTALVVETPENPVHWMSPDDVSPEEFLRNFSGRPGSRTHPTGVHIMTAEDIFTAEDTVRFLPFDISLSVLKALMTRAGKEQIPDF